MVTDKIVLRREQGKWRLTEPVKDQADNAAIDNLLSDIETLAEGRHGARQGNRGGQRVA